MTRRSNLDRRKGGTYYARIYIPADLRDHFKSEDKKVSLRTKDEAVAKQRLYIELHKWERQFDDIRARRQVTPTDVSAAVWQHYESVLARDAENRRAMPTPADIEAEVEKVWRKIDAGEIRSDDFISMFNGYADLELLSRARGDDANLRRRRLAALKRDLVVGEVKLVDAAAREFVERARLLIDVRSGEFRELATLMIRAEIQALERTLEHDAGDYSGTPTDPLVRPAFTAPSANAAPGEGIMELFEKYARENPGGIKQDTLAQARRDIGTFAQHVGYTCPASRIDKKAVREWKALLLEYPVKATETKEFRGMKISQIVQHNKTVGKPKITSRTVNRYLSSLAAFCNWLVAHGYIDNNPTDRMFLAKDKRKKVFPFTVEQMHALFTSPFFTGCISDQSLRYWNKAGDVKIRDHRYWVPLIMLYSGARPGEISQLHLSDVRREEEFWILDIVETDDEDEEGLKSLKTAGSRRVVPVHRELMALGFLEYVEEMLRAKHTKLFPQATRNTRGQMIADFSRDFSRYLTKIGVKKGRGVSLYSFRHGAMDAMRRAGYLDDQFNFIFGHGSGSKVTRGYGVLTQGMTAQRAELINAITYPGLDIDHLKPSRSSN